MRIQYIGKAFYGLLFAVFSSCVYSQDFYIGIGSHFGQKPNSSPANALRSLQETGASSFRDEIYWSSVELSAGTYKVPEYLQRLVIDANKNGIKPLIVLGYGNRSLGINMPISEQEQSAYAQYVEQVARALKGNVAFYEIWNEWNLGTGSGVRAPGSASDYVRLIRKVYPVIKRVDRDAKVLVGSVGSFKNSWSWTSAFVALRGLDYSDGFSFHSYNFLDGVSTSPEQLYGDVEKYLLRLRAAANSDVSAYITEAGWPGGSSRVSSSDMDVAEYLAKYFFLLKTNPSVKGLWWYSLSDDGFSKEKYEHNFGLVKANSQRKPAFNNFVSLSSLLRDASYSGRLFSSSDLFALKFTQQDGSYFVVAWSKSGRVYSLTNRASSVAKYRFLNGSDSNVLNTLSVGSSVSIDATPCILFSNETPVLSLNP